MAAKRSYRVPVISKISPINAVAGTSDLTLTVTGTNFANGVPYSSWVRWIANDSPTNLWNASVVTDSELTVRIPASLLASAGMAHLLVENGDPMAASDGYDGYPKSNAVDFEITETADPVAVYAATLTASSRCAAVLRSEARERTYIATCEGRETSSGQAQR
jgi:hypothetical protein